MTTKHTKGPYAVRHERGNRFSIVAASPNVPGLEQTVCEINGPWSHENYKANAERIALCLNSHDALVEALEELLGSRCFRNDLSPDHHATLDRARVALENAGGAS